jgi:hypothetical protein
VDPHAENYLPISPYAYVGNNPIVRIDPDGRDWYEDKEGKMLFDPNLSKDNHETYMQENGIEGKYWGSTGFSINEESGLSIAYFSDGNSKEGLWQLSEVVVEAEMGKSARTRMNAEKLGLYAAQNNFLLGAAQLSAHSFNIIGTGSQVAGTGLMAIPGLQPLGGVLIGGGNILSGVGTSISMGLNAKDGEWGQFVNNGSALLLSTISPFGVSKLNLTRNQSYFLDGLLGTQVSIFSGIIDRGIKEKRK